MRALKVGNVFGTIQENMNEALRNRRECLERGDLAGAEYWFNRYVEQRAIAFRLTGRV